MMYPTRLICSVFEEMRGCIETLNFSYLRGLIEEAQTLANRMESGLAEQKDLELLHKERKKLSLEVDELKEKLEELKKEKDQF